MPTSSFYNAFSASSDSSLPTYSRVVEEPSGSGSSRRWTEQTYVLTSEKKKKQWGFLKIRSNAKPSGPSLPVFYEGDKVAGSFELELDSPDFINSIELHLLGRIVSGHSEHDSLTFLKSATTLWSRNSGDPRQLNSQAVKHWKDGLLGSYSWPFSIDLPRSLHAPMSSDNKTLKEFRLPPTFTDKAAPVTIQYSLLLWVTRPKLKSQSQISTAFVYMPATRPGPSSSLRQMSEREHGPLLGPDIDPEGWQPLEPVHVKGRLFGKSDSSISIRLFLSNPVSYTCGSSVVLFLSLCSSSRMLLDLISSKGGTAAKPIQVRLRRKVKYQPASRSSLSQNTSGLVYFNRDGVKKVKRTLAVAESGDVGVANWWASPSSPPDSERMMVDEKAKREMFGEIPLARSLIPSCEMSHFGLSYSLLLTLDIPGFVPHVPSDSPLLERTIEVVTMCAKGMRPRRYAPPGYERRPQTSDGRPQTSDGSRTTMPARLSRTTRSGPNGRPMSMAGLI